MAASSVSSSDALLKQAADALASLEKPDSDKTFVLTSLQVLLAETSKKPKPSQLGITDDAIRAFAASASKRIEQAESDTADSPLFEALLQILTFLCREPTALEDFHAGPAFKRIMAWTREMTRSFHVEALKVFCNSILNSSTARQTIDPLQCFDEQLSACERDPFVVVRSQDTSLHSQLGALMTVRYKAIYGLFYKMRDQIQPRIRDVHGIDRILQLMHLNCTSQGHVPLVIKVLVEQFRLLFALTAVAWYPKPGQAGSLYDDVPAEERDAVAEEFGKAVPIIFAAVVGDRFGHNETLVQSALELAMNAPPGCLGLLFAALTTHSQEEATEPSGDGSAPDAPADAASGPDLSSSAQEEDSNVLRNQRVLAMQFVDALCSNFHKRLHELDGVITNDRSAVSISPHISILSSICRQSRPGRCYVRSKVLPRRADLSQGPEQGDSLRALLVRTMTATSNHLAMLAGDLLLACCNDKAYRLVRHVGYGNAAGFLAMRGIQGMPMAPDDADESSDEDADVVEDVDPVTGRRPREPTQAPQFESEEEKEKSAEELMHLIDELNKRGIFRINFQTPSDSS